MRDYIGQLKQRLNIGDNPYFHDLSRGVFSREDFVETQIQFLFAVVFFSRPMMVLAARLPRPEMRLTILQNVHEEHGEGTLSLSHEATFLQLLNRLGVSLEQLDQRALWPEVRAFNTSLAGLCTLDDVFSGVAALGMIEDLFAGISSRIGEAIVEQSWLTQAQIVHYTTHEVLDEEHADDFYRIIEPYYDEHPRHTYQIQQGLEMGAYIFLQMYRGLHAARARRWTRNVTGPHSLSDGWFIGSATQIDKK